MTKTNACLFLVMGLSLILPPVPSINSSALKYLNFSDAARLDEFFDHTAFLSMKHDLMGRLDFHPTSDPTEIGKGALPNYNVDDIEKVKTWLESMDIRVSDIQQTGDSPKHAWFWDHEGNIIGLEQF